MRKRVFYLAFALFSLAVASCKEDENLGEKIEQKTGEEDENPPQSASIGWLMEGDFMRWLEFTCPATYKDVKLTDYSKLEFIVHPYTGESMGDYVEEEYRAYNKLMWDYCKERTATIVRACEEYGHGSVWPKLYSSYTCGEISFTCDKTLFGQEPGTDLSTYFTADSGNPCSVVGENMDFLYNFGEEAPTNMRDYFPVGVWLACEYTVKPISCPKEKYDRLTFHLSIPVHSEHIGGYVWGQLHGLDQPLKTHDAVIEADCEVEFAWE